MSRGGKTAAMAGAALDALLKGTPTLSYKPGHFVRTSFIDGEIVHEHVPEVDVMAPRPEWERVDPAQLADLGLPVMNLMTEALQAFARRYPGVTPEIYHDRANMSWGLRAPANVIIRPPEGDQ